MTFKRYGDVSSFYRDTYDVLMRHEAQNNMLLGTLIIGHKGADRTGWRNPANWLMVTVSDDDAIRLTALMTPPHNLTLYATDHPIDGGTLMCMAEGIAQTGVSVDGVMAENALAEAFAGAYAAVAGKAYAIQEKLRIYELLQVDPRIPTAGTLRLARESDMAFLPYWREGFASECFGASPAVQGDADDYRYHITSGSCYILEMDGMPVSMARATRETHTACGVGGVYTPPYFRGRGYATSCVAALSRCILKRGFTRCVLFTDLANPTSNSIYQKIGYRSICDSLEIKFC